MTHERIRQSCPFCGSQITEERTRGFPPLQSCCIYCGECGATGPKSDSGEEAWSSWNGRSHDTADFFDPVKYPEQNQSQSRTIGGTMKTADCDDCGRQYGNEHGFPDLIITKDAWQRISPTGDDGGLLCPSCICKRLHDAGMHDVEGAFASGPIKSVDPSLMHTLRWMENLREQFERLEKRLGER